MLKSKGFVPTDSLKYNLGGYSLTSESLAAIGQLLEQSGSVPCGNGMQKQQTLTVCPRSRGQHTDGIGRSAYKTALAGTDGCVLFQVSRTLKCDDVS
jgi:hypothetical protein